MQRSWAAALPTAGLVLCLSAGAANALTFGIDNSRLELNGVETFFQGFETDTTGWFPFNGSITQVASGGGTLGLTSATGGGHAEVVVGPNTGNGAYTAFGDYSPTWPGTSVVQFLDIYIDPGAGTIGDNVFLDNALSNTGGTWLEAGGVGMLRTADGWWVMADADGGGYLGPPEGGVGLLIDSAGWYTFVSEWAINADNDQTIDRNTYVLDDDGDTLYEQFYLQQVALASAGGTNYGWLAANSVSPEAVPAPAGVGLLGLGLLLLAARRRRR